MTKRSAHKNVSNSTESISTDVSVNIADGDLFNYLLIPKTILLLGLLASLILFLYYLLNPTGWINSVAESKPVINDDNVPTTSAPLPVFTTGAPVVPAVPAKMSDGAIAGIVIGSLLLLFLLVALVYTRKSVLRGFLAISKSVRGVFMETNPEILELRSRIDGLYAVRKTIGNEKGRNFIEAELAQALSTLELLENRARPQMRRRRTGQVFDLEAATAYAFINR